MYTPANGHPMATLGTHGPPIAPPRHSSLQSSASHGRLHDSRSTRSSDSSSLRTSHSNPSFDSRRSSSDSSKPRLSREQHGYLERKFSEQRKPTTNVKKQFADQLGVPLDKINNWFQNRRAKVKHEQRRMEGSTNFNLMFHQPMMNNGHNQPIALNTYYPYASVPPFGPAASMPADGALQPGPTLGPDAFVDPSSTTHTYPYGMPWDQSQITHPYMAEDASNLSFLGIQSDGINGNDFNQQPREEFAGPQHETMWSIEEEAEDNDQASRNMGGAASNGTGPSFHSNPSNNTHTPLNDYQPNHDLDPADFSDLLMPDGRIQNPEMDEASVARMAPPAWTHAHRMQALHLDAQRSQLDFYGIPQSDLPYRATTHSGASQEGSTVAFHAFHPAPAHSDQPLLPSQAAHASPVAPKREQRADSAIQPPQMTLTSADEPRERRESTVSNLGRAMSGIDVTPSASEETQMLPTASTSSTGMAARRQGRPPPIRTGSSGMRSASQTSMPSPRNLHSSSSDQLRRIKSSGGLGQQGRIHKSGSVSSQKSPMTAAFSNADLAIRMTSSQSMNNLVGNHNKTWKREDDVPMTPATPPPGDGRLESTKEEHVVSVASMPEPLTHSTQVQCYPPAPVGYMAPSPGTAVPDVFFSHGQFMPYQVNNMSPPSTPSFNMGYIPVPFPPSSQMAQQGMPSFQQHWQSVSSQGSMPPPPQPYFVNGDPVHWAQMEEQQETSPRIVLESSGLLTNHEDSVQDQMFTGQPHVFHYHPGMPVPMMQMTQFASEGPMYMSHHPPDMQQQQPAGAGPMHQHPPQLQSQHRDLQRDPQQQQHPTSSQDEQEPNSESSSVKPFSGYMTSWDSNPPTRGVATPTRPAIQFQTWNPTEGQKVPADKLPPRSRDGSAQYTGEFTFHNMTPSTIGNNTMSSPVRS